MADLHQHDMWEMLFEQTPTVWRWIFIILSGGLFALAGYIWRGNKDELRTVAKKQDDFITDKNFNFYTRMMTEKVDGLDTKFSGRLETLEVYMRALTKQFISQDFEPDNYFERDKREHED